VNSTTDRSLQRANNLNHKVFDHTNNHFMFSPMSMASTSRVPNANQASFVLQNMQSETNRTQNISVGSTPNTQRKHGIHHSQTSIGRSINKMETSSTKPKFLERFNSFNPPRDK